MTNRASGRLTPVAVLVLSLAACGGGSDGGNPTVYYTLSVQKSGSGFGTVTGGGISCGATCTASLASGTAVTLTATPDAGSTFVSWAGCDTTAGATCNVTMNANKTVTAIVNQLPGLGSLYVVNSTSYTITELYVSPAGAGTWGPNQLVSPIVPTTGTFTLTSIPVGSYDFRAVASDGIAYWQTSSVSITDGGLATWTLLPPQVGSLSVVNSHCVALTELYVRPSSLPTYSPNQLTIPVDPMGTFTLTGIPVGTYDLQAAAIDGTTTWATNGIPITAGGTFTWTLLMSAGTGCLTVVNNTADTIDLLFDPLSSPGDPCPNRSNWGLDQLLGSIIPPGTSFTLSNVPQGTHDLWASGLTPMVDLADYVVCGIGISAGGILTWPLNPNP